MRLKKGVSVFLAFALSATMLSIPAFADAAASSEDFTISGGVLTAYTGQGGSVAIPDGVTTISDTAFAGRSDLSGVDIPASVSNIENEAFFGCTGLEYIDVSPNNADYASVGGCLCSKNKTKLILYPAGSTWTLNTVPDGVTDIGASAFRNCTNLQTLNIPGSVRNIGKNAFYGCANLKTVKIAEGLTSIGDGAFWNCEGLASIYIPASVTSISGNAFYFSPDNPYISGDLTVYGAQGSYAQTYAEANGIKFAAETPTGGNVGIEYSSHVQSIGWQSFVKNGAESGTDGRSLRVEATKIKLDNAPTGASVTYQTHVQSLGWQQAVSNGAQAGTTGKSLRVEAIKITLNGLPGYSVMYRVHVQNIGWMAWQTTANGTDISRAAVAGTTGRSLRVEAVEIKLVKTAQ